MKTKKQKNKKTKNKKMQRFRCAFKLPKNQTKKIDVISYFIGKIYYKN